MTRTRILSLYAALAVALVPVTFAVWFGLNGIQHLINDHKLLHQLVQIEVARQNPTK